MNVDPMAMHLVPHLHALYLATPAYFELLGTDVPSLNEVEREVEAALLDPRRRLSLLTEAGEVLGCLDCKREYPLAGDLTINLLLVRGDLQRRRIGTRAVQRLEAQLSPTTTRLLASVLGDNAAAARFWERRGFHFEIDARPAMTWYAKAVHASAPGAAGQPLAGSA